MPKDVDRKAIPAMSLYDPHDVDGSQASAQSDAIDGYIVRIAAQGADIRFLIGANPTALATSNFLASNQEIWMPITPGQKVAILGGKANIATAGEGNE